MSETEIKQFTLDEISKHNKEEDAWIILNGKVYDITEFAEEHPGGEIILDFAGMDGTEAFSILIRWRTPRC